MKLLFWRTEKREPMERPIDAAINAQKALLKKWEAKQQKEIVEALLQEVFPAHHVHLNPRKKAA
jgi:hypothetical protein